MGLERALLKSDGTVRLLKVRVRVRVNVRARIRIEIAVRVRIRIGVRFRVLLNICCSAAITFARP